MKGHVPTPDQIVDDIVKKLFDESEPTSNDELLDPGCGGGAFIAGVLRWCEARGCVPPKITGIELNPSLAAKARKRFASHPSVRIIQADYLQSQLEPTYRYIVGNPPYVSLGKLGGAAQRDRYRKRFNTARGRFDLYMLFFERSLDALAPGGRLVFITPEKFLYVGAATELRKLLVSNAVVSCIRLAPEDAFPGLTTYPAITTVIKFPQDRRPTEIELRNGAHRRATLPEDGSSWWPKLMSDQDATVAPRLDSVCVRVSAGIATGADDVYVHEGSKLPKNLRPYAKPAIAGRDLTPGSPLPIPHRVILVPYTDAGELLPRKNLGALGRYLSKPPIKGMLMNRVCAARKSWYAFHDNYPIEMLRPKILFKDITKKPQFWIDRTGEVIPLHSVYYIVPKNEDQLDALCNWLNGEEAARWLEANCQRAANGFLRLQSKILRELPVPANVFSKHPLRNAA